jgi:predicted lysophospholipase L1 biosynthesis ABC-type transport system permease subunit
MSVNRTGGALERMCHGIIVLVSVLVPRSRRSGWREEWESEVWHHLHTHGQGSGALPGAALLVRCLGAFPHALWEIDATQPLTRTLDLEQMVGSALAPGRFQALLLGLFSVFAVGLAGVGVYSILAEGVNERRREIGVRMAMGAQPSSVVQEVVRRGLRLAVASIAVGGLVAFGVTRLLATLLFGVGPRDPLAFLLTPLFLIAVVALASCLPARQAARIDPSAALRNER